ncbi:hypothetical protein [Desertibacillus haloalkaliphilus]|uniref:hypothetical protein n=1 Tax=Desertibacillus haloalkaliphilus TaxID=1328930 RepID=UPI001C27EBCF|nr:hypothetical protein [Desertibacillus haloalkaliphilus]MBU8905929.1 hypothetical protein [Desertibacillus haloalkaliphilus]
MKKKLILGTASAVLALGVLTACGETPEEEAPIVDEEPIEAPVEDDAGFGEEPMEEDGLDEGGLEEDGLGEDSFGEEEDVEGDGEDLDEEADFGEPDEDLLEDLEEEIEE